MKRITKDMVSRSGWRYCCVCRKIGPRVKAHWEHADREYCDAHKPTDEDVPAVRLGGKPESNEVQA